MDRWMNSEWKFENIENISRTILEICCPKATPLIFLGIKISNFTDLRTCFIILTELKQSIQLVI